MSSSEGKSGIAGSSSAKPSGDEEVREILHTFNDLRHYTKEMENELKTTENKSYSVYLKESENIASLHVQICECDQIVARMEKMLLGLHTNVGTIKTEVSQLQKRSIEINQELLMRQTLKQDVIQLLDDIKIPETIIAGIIRYNVTDESFLTELYTLNAKLIAIKQQKPQDTSYSQTIRDVLESIRVIAVSKIEKYLQEQISKFKKPITDSKTIQHDLIQHKVLFQFLLTHEKKVAQEIQSKYINTMSNIYYTHSKAYETKILKLRAEDIIKENDFLGAEDRRTKDKTSVFFLGNRRDVLKNLEQLAIAASDDEKKYQLESIFKSVQFSLLNNSFEEYKFICEYFVVKNDRALDLFSSIMDKNFKYLQKSLETILSSCYDPITTFLCFNITLRYRGLCKKRSMLALDQHWDALEKLLLSRFEQILQRNITSIRDNDAAKFNFELGPHYIARRYPELVAALANISLRFDNEVVNKLMRDLQDEMDRFLLRMASAFTQSKDQLVFIINNYEVILGTLMETTNNTNESKYFKSRISDKTCDYVEEILIPHFGKLLDYIKVCEHHLELVQIKELKALHQKAPSIVEDFNYRWRESLEKLNTEVLLAFPNLITAKNILQLTFTQLMHYYHRFYKLSTPDIRADISNIHDIVQEMNKYNKFS